MKIRHLLLLASVLIGCKEPTLFEQVSSRDSGITFNNKLEDNDSLNVLDVENIYNGGGVGVGDFNNDGLQDLYFAGNNVPNKLYLNKGDLKFEDITQSAGVDGAGRWSRGISVVDINSDGLQDIYVCASLLPDSKRRENLLYVNKGLKNGVPVFANEAAAYGLADTSHTTMAAFFDYDNDGDLDVYLLVNEILKNQYPNTFRPILNDGSHPNTDKLLRNDYHAALKHPVFTDVSREAGITVEGYGHGINIVDINKDGWKDIYITNDFLSNNNLFINQRNGSFRDEVKAYFKHTSENAMGQDVTDINNDGLVDVIEADMSPEDNYRKKMMLNPISYQRYQNNALYDFQDQYVRNSIQVNQGFYKAPADSAARPVFSDLGFLTGMAETDWSWTPVVADFDNDGLRDIIITNGFPKDVTDHDFIAFRNKANLLSSKREILDQIPQVKIANYAFHNRGGLQFVNATANWGLSQPSFSNGSVYADMDNDGDLDLVMNNINDEALVYRNNARQQDKEANHFLRLHLKGDAANPSALGAQIELRYKGTVQVYELTPYRGYLSSIQLDPQFGVGKNSVVDSILVSWPNGKQQLLQNVKADQTVQMDIRSANAAVPVAVPAINASSLFQDITNASGIRYVHHDSDFIDFNVQKLLPHKLSEYGPALAVGDMDGNGLDDLVCGGSFFYHAQLLLQQKDGRFIQKSLEPQEYDAAKRSEDMGLLLFDADGDQDLDLYIASGGYEAEPGSPSYQDRFYMNDGRGNFSIQVPALPQLRTSKSCVRAADYDRDGDLDLFVAGRVDPWFYPRPVSSYLLRNDSKPGAPRFTDITKAVIPALQNIGLVCDALFTDFNNDGWPDLALAGEWMPLTFIANNKGAFTGGGAVKQLPQSSGWWNSLTPGDFDNDGDMDYVAGNLGKNAFYRNRNGKPVCITAADFDQNGSYDAIPSLFIPTSATDTTLKEFPGPLRDDMSKQMISMRSKFQTYQAFAKAALPEVLTDEQRKGAIRLEANQLQSVLVRNDGAKGFSVVPLPLAAQVAPLFGMVAEDFDADGNLDLAITGNDYSVEAAIGRYDALNGLVLRGDGKGGFSPLTLAQSGLYLPGAGKAMVYLQGVGGRMLVAASQTKGPLKIFALQNQQPLLAIPAGAVKATLIMRDGSRQQREFYGGASFLSQPGRLVLGGAVQRMEVVDRKGKKLAGL
ncbi:Repeat domain-containing protein [Cnuella takakiae]|uniref:Repeat domain-containing protein n=1 Tax=Cnuella takakiae TaxID=1302690 RepID=A0A1M4WUH3_9BACT|nr:VCBS repeat-containing protein [Cnuella takakiae]OLY91616.1 RNA-binding protein [Cnuella takakiae]SHE84817.1 Repeat domain-containing protein [Cnuella takakiae]